MLRKVNTFTILTNDPSMTGWGWAIIQNGLVIDSGCIKTQPEQKKRRIRKGDDTIRRICLINSTLMSLISKYRVNFLLSELPHGSQNAAAAVMIGAVTGIIQTLADAWDLPVEWYSEQDSKKQVLGKNTATKTEMVDAMFHRFTLRKNRPKYVQEAVADALAIYCVAYAQSPTLKIMR
jgi:Holliday junction resolvasome RuvABC endonuclease subunit